MSRDQIRDFLDGFGGRVILMVVGGVTMLAMSVGAWFALAVYEKQEKTTEALHLISEKLATTNGEKVSRQELEAKMDAMRRESLEQRAEIMVGMTELKKYLDQMNDLLLSRSKTRDGAE